MLKGLLKEAGSLGPSGGAGNEAQLHPPRLHGAAACSGEQADISLWNWLALCVAAEISESKVKADGKSHLLWCGFILYPCRHKKSM